MIWVIGGVIICIWACISMYRDWGYIEWQPPLILLAFCITIGCFIGAVPMAKDNYVITDYSYPLYELSENEYIRMDKNGNLITYLGPEEGYKYDEKLDNNEYYVVEGEPRYVKRITGRLKGTEFWFGIHFPTSKDIYYLTDPYINLLS